MYLPVLLVSYLLQLENYACIAITCLKLIVTYNINEHKYSLLQFNAFAAVMHLINNICMYIQIVMYTVWCKISMVENFDESGLGKF